MLYAVLWQCDSSAGQALELNHDHDAGQLKAITSLIDVLLPPEFCLVTCIFCLAPCLVSYCAVSLCGL